MKRKKPPEKKSIKIQKKHIVFALLLVIASSINFKLFLFAILTFASAVFSYYHDKHNRTPFDFRPALFLGIIITRFYGLEYTLAYFIISNVIPTILAGGRIEGSTFIFYVEFFVFFASVLLFPKADIIFLGIILICIEAVLGTFINQFFGVPGFLAISAGIIAICVRAIYFMTIGEFMVFVFHIFHI